MGAREMIQLAKYLHCECKNMRSSVSRARVKRAGLGSARRRWKQPDPCLAYVVRPCPKE